LIQGVETSGLMRQAMAEIPEGRRAF